MRNSSGWAAFSDVDIKTRPGVPDKEVKKILPINAAQFTWTPCDLAALLNRPLADEVAGDGKGGWSDQGPTMDLRGLHAGDYTFSGVAFHVPEGNACFIMKSKWRPSENLPDGGKVELRGKADVLAFLHSGAWLAANIQHATYVIHYADGGKVEIPVVAGKNILDWALPGSRADDVQYDPALGLLLPAVSVPSPQFVHVTVWMTLWKNPRPGVEIAALEVKGANEGIPGLIAVARHRQMTMRPVPHSGGCCLSRLSPGPALDKRNCANQDDSRWHAAEQLRHCAVRCRIGETRNTHHEENDIMSKRASKIEAAAAICFCLVFAGAAFSQDLSGLYRITDGVSRCARRIPRRQNPPGKGNLPAQFQGPGKATYFYFTDDTGGKLYQGLVLKVFWDEEKEPSIQVPLADFFGAIGGKTIDYQSSPMQINHLCYMRWLPMPFSRQARFLLANDGDKEYTHGVAYGIDCEQDQQYAREKSRLHCMWRRSNPVQGGAAAGPLDRSFAVRGRTTTTRDTRSSM